MRKKAFQLKYALALGLRPSSLDPRTHEVLALQCAFCAVFGREPRAANDPEEPENEANAEEEDAANGGQVSASAPVPRRPRARTTNVRTWAPPLRPDNIRLHMRAQHPTRFISYSAIVTRAKQDGSFQAAADLGVAALFPALASSGDEPAPVDISPAVVGAARELLMFFGDAPVTVGVSSVSGLVAAPVRATTAEKLQVQAANVAKQRAASVKSAPALLVKRVAVPEVMTELLETLVSLVDPHNAPSALHGGVDDGHDDEEAVPTHSGGTKRRRRRQGGRSQVPAGNETAGDDDVVESNTRLTIRRVVPVEDEAAASGKSSRNNTRESFEIDVKNADELAKAQRMLSLGLSFDQTAQVLALTDDGEGASEPLSARTIASFARVSIVSALDMIADLMRRTWTFAVAFEVSDRGPGSSVALAHDDGTASPPSPFYRAIDVCVRIPVAGSDGANDALPFHVVALPLLPFEHSLERTVTYLMRFLDVLDPNWTRKLMGCCVNANGASTDDTDTLFSASLLAQRVAHHALSSAPPEAPFYQLWRPAQQLTDVLQRALCEIKGTIVVNDVRVDMGFTWSLSSVTTFLRGQESWIRVHGRCPTFDTPSPWSVLRTGRWLLARREAVNELYATASQLNSAVHTSTTFWLILFAVTDVLAMFEHVQLELEAFPMPSGRESRRKITESVRMLMDKTGITLSTFPVSSSGSADGDFSFSDNLSRLGRFEWHRDPDLVRYLRSLNLSSRRLYSETSAANQGRAEFSITCFTLRAVYSISLIADDFGDIQGELPVAVTPEAPPTLPLQFVDLDRSRVVDLIEQHSPRLEKAFGVRFLDRISNDIERLRSLAGTASGAHSSPFRAHLERVQSQSFHDAWAMLVPHGIASLRRFAAGLATVLPRTDNIEDTLGAANAAQFPVRDEDQFRSNFADLAIEARLHCAQARRLMLDVHTR